MNRLVSAALAFAAVTGAAGAASAQTGPALVDSLFSGLESELGLSASSRATGSLGANQKTTGTVNVPAGATYVLIGVCDEGCSDLDLVVRDSSGAEIGSDYEDDDSPIVFISDAAGGRYTFEVQMVTCSSSCNWGVRGYNAGE